MIDLLKLNFLCVLEYVYGTMCHMITYDFIISFISFIYYILCATCCDVV